MNTRPCSAPRGAGQSGRCPAHRTVPGGFEAFGAAQATNVVVVNGSLVDGRQELLTANLGSAPRRQAVDVTNAPSGALEAGNSLEGTPTLMRQKTSHSGPKLESKKTSDMQLYPPPPPPPVLRAASAAVAILLGTLCSHAADRFVSLAGGHVPPFTSWADAATNIQAAVDAASAGETVWVTNGVYATGGKVKAGSLTNRVALDKAITLQSINGAAETIIEGAWDSTSTNGPGAVRCVWLADGAVIRGFTLRNGATASSGDTTTLRSGGAVWGNSTNAWVEDCVLTKSRASSFGGGAWNARLRNCAVVGNAAGSQGGGVYSSAVESSTVSGNFASSYGGGAAYALLTSSRVTANRAVVRGGGSYNGTLNNCAVVQNELSGAGAGGKDGAGSLGSTLNNCTVIWNRSVGSSTTGAGRLLWRGQQLHRLGELCD
jgi:hypothetical protein